VRYHFEIGAKGVWATARHNQLAYQKDGVVSIKKFLVDNRKGGLLKVYELWNKVVNIF
jgi:hypothetical protein